MKNPYLEGLRFGMLLQLAIGPMCLMVFQTSKNAGFLPAFSLVVAIALVDAFYITLGALGASKLLTRPGAKRVLKTGGAVVLVLFGLNMILGTFGVSFIPGLDLSPASSSAFLQGLVLTLSTPLTIVFWGSVLTTKLTEEKMEAIELRVFSCGLVSATVFFMTGVAVAGTILASFLPQWFCDLLNIFVGLLIIYFGLKSFLKK